MSLRSIGAACTKEMENLCIIFTIVRQREAYGMLSSVALGFLGLCLDKFLTCMHVGGQLVPLEEKHNMSSA
jgi:hypothetical protein